MRWRCFLRGFIYAKLSAASARDVSTSRASLLKAGRNVLRAASKVFSASRMRSESSCSCSDASAAALVLQKSSSVMGPGNCPATCKLQCDPLCSVMLIFTYAKKCDWTAHNQMHEGMEPTSRQASGFVASTALMLRLHTPSVDSNSRTASFAVPCPSLSPCRCC